MAKKRQWIGGLPDQVKDPNICNKYRWLRLTLVQSHCVALTLQCRLFVIILRFPVPEFRTQESCSTAYLS